MAMECSRSEFLTCAGACTLAALLPRRSAAGETGAAKRPNFLVILTDDQTFRAIGYNNPLVKTPALDALAREGLILENAYVASPICVASRSSIMTGMFPEQHGSVGLDASGFQRCVVEEHRYVTLAHCLAGAGYTTGFCGKSHLGDPKTYGFSVGQEHAGYDDPETFAAAKAFLQGQTPESPPFLLWVGARQPHVPLRPAQEWLDLYANVALEPAPNFMEQPPAGSLYNQGLPGEQYYRDSEVRDNYKKVSSGPPRTREQILDFTRAYYATISHLDHQIGEMMDTLRASGHYDNTYIIYLSDNGYHLGTHGLGNKITMHEESVRVPMFIHSPLLPRKGARSTALVSSLDVFPTLADLAGVPRPEQLWGRSLRPLFEHPEEPLREYVPSECVGVGGKPGMGHRMVRTAQWKYVLTDTNDEALFDQVNDPYELANVIGEASHAELTAQLRGFLREWMAQVGDTHQPPPAG